MLIVQAPKIHHLDGGVSPMREIRQPQLSFSPYLQVLGVLLLVVFAGFSVSGQTNFGRISGTVTDSSGAVVPSATVTVTNAATNAVRTTTTDEGGFYTVTNLPVGTYTVTVERSGFKKANQTDNALTADQRLTVSIELEAGLGLVKHVGFAFTRVIGKTTTQVTMPVLDIIQATKTAPNRPEPIP